MSHRVLVAGIGNVFFGDDGFGVAVARELRERRARRDPEEFELPASVVVEDFGIRGLHLAYELLEGWSLLIAMDAVARGEPPGTLHVIEPSPEADRFERAHDAHGMDLRSVLGTARSLGATLPAVLVVGCEVTNVSEGIGLAPEVEAAVPRAARLVVSLVREHIKRSPSVTPTGVKEANP